MSIIVARPLFGILFVLAAVAVWWVLRGRPRSIPLPSLRIIVREVPQPSRLRHLPLWCAVAASMFFAAGAVGMVGGEGSVTRVPQHREVVWVLDFSGSMEDREILVLREFVLAAVREEEHRRSEGLSDTTFSAVLFADNPSLHSEVTARWLERLLAGGGNAKTNLSRRLEENVKGALGTGTLLGPALISVFYGLAVRGEVFSEYEMLGESAEAKGFLHRLADRTVPATTSALAALVLPPEIREAGERKRTALTSTMVVIVTDGELGMEDRPPPEWAVLLLREIGVKVGVVQIWDGGRLRPGMRAAVEDGQTSFFGGVSLDSQTRGRVWVIEGLRGQSEDLFRTELQEVFASIDQLVPQSFLPVEETVWEERWELLWGIAAAFYILGWSLQLWRRFTVYP